MMNRHSHPLPLSGISVLLLGAFAWASPPLAAQAPERPYTITEEREPCRDYRPEKQVFWGDTHVHTAYSFDASMWDTRNDPDDAYRFARGEPAGILPYSEQGEAQRWVQLPRPLDFAMVSDHAEHLGRIDICARKDLLGYYSINCRIFRGRPQLSFFTNLAMPLILKELTLQNDNWRFLKKLFRAEQPPLFCGPDNRRCYEAARPVWKRIQAAAERAYDRSTACRFTSFVGYEWTAYTGGNIHRNVVFRNERVPADPISANEAPEAPGLWRALDRECIQGVPGCDVLVIPHNSNVSRGLMFPDPGGERTAPHNPRTAVLSARFDRLFEIMQHKGDSECWYGQGIADELCAFEKLSYDALGAQISPRFAIPSHPSDGFLRPVLSSGLVYQRQFGVNPYRLGVIASTDNHLGTPGSVEEYNFVGHTGISANRNFQNMSAGLRLPDSPNFNPGGLAAVWAEENTRDSLFSAMRRRETYGTSGPRLEVRFFGGWNYPADLCRNPDWVKEAYAGGVPMGGVLAADAAPGTAAAPRFLLYARRDPGVAGHPGLPLQYMQLIKGWVDERGTAQEKVYDVAGNPDSEAGVDSDCRPHGAGYQRLCQVWSDPDFDAGRDAWYYARVLQNPSCRWSARWCSAQGVNCEDPASVPAGMEACCAADHRRVIRERAWTSPIWYQAQP